MNRWLSPLCLFVLATWSVTAQSGLVPGTSWSYEVIRPGNGPQVARSQAVLTHNQLIDSEGHVLISTVSIQVPDYQLISELSEPFQAACEIMQPGGLYRFRIPAAEWKAAARGGAQMQLPPGEVTWEVELLQLLPPKPDVARVVALVYQSEGVDAAFRKWQELRGQRSTDVYFGEWEINQLGYLFLQQGRTEEAVEILLYNVQAHPNSFNAHDSLGEAYYRANNKPLAAQHYRRSLELNPANENARRFLNDLENR